MIGLSQSSLKLFTDCPKCFWFEKINKISRPSSPVAGITRGVDRSMKEYTERAIAEKLPNQYLIGLGVAPFADRAKMLKFRKWQTFQGIFEVDGVQVKAWGELDELVSHEDGRVSPWDYKSKGAPLSYEEALEDVAKWNQSQADMYDLLVGAQGLTPTGKVFFTYTWPEVVEDERVLFGHVTVQVESHREDALALLGEATRCLALEKPPAPSADCDYCHFISLRKSL